MSRQSLHETERWETVCEIASELAQIGVTPTDAGMHIGRHFGFSPSAFLNACKAGHVPAYAGDWRETRNMRIAQVIKKHLS